MLDQPNIHVSRVSRRRFLALVAGAAASTAAARTSRLAAQSSVVATPLAPKLATPAAGTPVGEALPLPSTLSADASPAFRAVAEALVAAMRDHHIPGAALGLLMGDREEHATFGLASLSSLAPVTPETLFQSGSLSKTFTATAIWGLIDQGLTLDAPVRAYLPDFKLADTEVAAKVTVANLLDHTGGWYGDALTVIAGFDTDYALARYVAGDLPLQPQLFPLGRFFSYNNSGFSHPGHLLEVATGTTYNAAMAELVLEPLGLAETLLERAEVRRRPFADGHVAEPINGQTAVAVQTPLWVPRAADPAGGIWSTTQDLIRYARFHFAMGAVPDAAQVVQPESLRRMQTPAKEIPGLPTAMGMNWFIQDVGGVRVIGHGGDTRGQHAEFIAIPAQRFAFVLLTNNDGGGSEAAPDVLDAALAHAPGTAALAGKTGLHRALFVPPGTPTVTLPSAKLAEYAGRYADPNMAVVVAPTAGGLQLTVEPPAAAPSWWPGVPDPPPGGPAPLAFVTQDVADVGGMRVPFVRDARGHVGGIALGLRLIPRTT